MKNSVLLLFLFFYSVNETSAQTAQYDFNSTATLLHPTIGDTALSAGVNAQSTNGFAGHGNIELEIPGASHKQASIYMEWGYTNREGNADFFEMDDMRIGMVGRVMTIKYATNDGGTIKVKEFSGISTGFVNGTNYLVAFSYDATSGIAYLLRDSDTIWSTPAAGGAVTPAGSNIVPGSPLAWSSSTSNAFIGNGMDGSGNINGTLDFFKIWSNTPLPVDFIDISATRIEDGVLVKWSTASELNNEMFIVQRSNDAKNFENVGKIAGAGNSISSLDYSYLDNPMKIDLGTIYYRIYQVDYDGRSDYSRVVSVKQVETKNSVSIFPNPISISSCRIRGWEDGLVTTMYNQLGEKVIESTSEFISFENIPRGVYHVVFQSSMLKHYTIQKLIVK